MRQQFKATIMDFTHRLYRCVNTRVVLVEQNIFSQHAWTFLLDFFTQMVLKGAVVNRVYCFCFLWRRWTRSFPQFGLFFWLWSIMVNRGSIHGQKSIPNSCESVSNSSKQSRGNVRQFRIYSTEISLGTHLIEILKNPSSFTIMFCARSYEMSTVIAISLIFNLRFPIIRSHIFRWFFGSLMSEAVHCEIHLQ